MKPPASHATALEAIFALCPDCEKDGELQRPRRHLDLWVHDGLVRPTRCGASKLWNLWGSALGLPESLRVSIVIQRQPGTCPADDIFLSGLSIEGDHGFVRTAPYLLPTGKPFEYDSVHDALWKASELAADVMRQLLSAAGPPSQHAPPSVDWSQVELAIIRSALRPFLQYDKRESDEKLCAAARAANHDRYLDILERVQKEHLQS